MTTPEPNFGQPRQIDMQHLYAPGYQSMPYQPMPYQPMFQPMPPPGPVHAPGPVTTVSVLLYIFSGFSLIGAIILAAGGALGSWVSTRTVTGNYTVSDVPGVETYTDRVMLLGFGGAVLLVLLATADIVLGICLSRGRRWAQLGTVALSVVIALASLATPLAPLCVIAGILLIVLITAPRTARRYFASRRQA